MSKNPAWNAYNEEVAKINAAYEAEVKPLRTALAKELVTTEKKWDAKIEPLIIEKCTALETLRKGYTDKVTAAGKKQREAVNRAHGILKAELDAQKQAATAA